MWFYGLFHLKIDKNKNTRKIIINFIIVNIKKVKPRFNFFNYLLSTAWTIFKNASGSKLAEPTKNQFTFGIEINSQAFSAFTLQP